MCAKDSMRRFFSDSLSLCLHFPIHEEALELLGNPQADGVFSQILDALFKRPTNDLTEFTFDTDTAVKANTMGIDKRTPTPSEGLLRGMSLLYKLTVCLRWLPRLTVSFFLSYS